MTAARRALFLASVATLAAPPLLAGAQTVPPAPHPNPLRPLRVIVFAGGFNLPIWAAQRQGFFAEERLEIRLTPTPNSVYQMTQLLAGNYDIGMTAMDNVVAYQEGQNEAPIGPDPDLFAFMGSDDAFLSIAAQPRIRRVEDLRGETLTVDAMTTGFAFVLREILARNNIPEDAVRFERAGGVATRFRRMLEEPSHAATMQMTPFELQGEAAGLVTLLRASDVIGRYQGICGVARRGFARDNRAAVVGFTRAYHRGVQWVAEPANRAVAEAILVANVPGMTPALAARSAEILLDPQRGFWRDLALDPAAIATVLALRSKYGQPRRELRDPARYTDGSFLAEALAGRRPG